MQVKPYGVTRRNSCDMQECPRQSIAGKFYSIEFCQGLLSAHATYSCPCSFLRWRKAVYAQNFFEIGISMRGLFCWRKKVEVAGIEPVSGDFSGCWNHSQKQFKALGGIGLRLIIFDLL